MTRDHTTANQQNALC